MKRPIVSLLLLAMPLIAFSQSRLDLLPYFSYINYNDAVIKNNSVVSGVYGFYGMGLNHSFEGDVSYTHIRYDEFLYNIGNQTFRTEPFTIDQLDMTFAYNNYQITNLKWRAGVHTILSDDSLTDNSYQLFAGVQRYRPYQYNAGIDIYTSFYNNYAPDLKVYQLTGTFGFYFGNYFTYGNFYAETKGYYIELSEDVGFNDKKFASVEQSLTYAYKNLTLRAFLWTGYQVFAIQKDGFVVYNLAERHLGAFGASAKHTLTQNSSLKFEISRGRFKELGAGNVTHSLKLFLIFGYSF